MGAKAFLLLRGLLTLLICLMAAPGWAGQIALVIGMGGYSHLTPLKNTRNDAEAVAATLQGLGVDVTLSIDATREELISTLADFTFRAETAELALVYFAGHGVELQGENFLIPVDAQVRSNREVQAQSVSLDHFMDAVSDARSMRLVILDACRDNPFGDLVEIGDYDSTEIRGMGATRSLGSQGLASVDPDRGTLVAFAASEGQVSFDGAGTNSPYATALVEALSTPGLEIGLLFRQVRDQVLTETGNRQEPYTYGSLSATPFFIGGPPPASGEAPPEVAEESAQEDLVMAWAELPAGQEAELLALAGSGDTRSMLALGFLRLNAGSPNYDPEEAVRFLDQAAAAGSPEAQYELAKLYREGVGVSRDEGRALELYEAAAAQDFAKAVNDLGVFHFHGELGLAPDREKAVELFGRAADLRHPIALYNYAMLIDDGLVPGKGPEAAGEYLYRALRSGSAGGLRQIVDRPSALKPETRKALQSELQRNGFYDGVIDGDFGAGTRAAIYAAFGISA